MLNKIVLNVAFNSLSLEGPDFVRKRGISFSVADLNDFVILCVHYDLIDIWDRSCL